MTIEEFNQCVDLHADNLYRFILKSVKDTDKAKDIVQDTYEKLWLKVSVLRRYECQKLYVYYRLPNHD